jgi:hypothetical protein
VEAALAAVLASVSLEDVLKVSSVVTASLAYE